MRIKSILLLLVCFLISNFSLPAIACPPGDCDDCETWNTETEKCDWDCTTEQCCYNDFCVDTCSGCYKCVDDYCEPCKCWDEGNPINGSINVQDAKLCEEVTHTSSISDTDHWYQGGNGGGGCEGNPSDTISYDWDQTADTNPEIGTFIGDTDESTVTWRAPSCKGTVIIKLDADDAPDSMDNPCPDSDRDDPNKVFEGTSTVSLPDGCVSGSTQTVSFSSTKLTSTEYCGTSCGRTGPMFIPTVTIPLPKYDGCKWIFSVSADGNTPCVVCPALFTEIENGNDPDITEENLCTIYNNFIEIEPSCPPYSKAECIELHEEAHYDDWLECLEAEECVFWGDPSISDMEIDCGDPSSTSCQAAKTARTSDIKAAVLQAWTDAAAAWNDMGETNPIEAAASCYEDLVDSICTVWDCGICTP